jgi:hypothetical protein
MVTRDSTAASVRLLKAQAATADTPPPSKLPETGVGDLFDLLVAEIAALNCVLFVVSEVADDSTLESPMPLRLMSSVECSLRQSIERLNALLKVIP